MADKNSQRVLVTGAGGSMGSRLTGFLLERGYHVALLYRSDRHTEPLRRVEKAHPDMVCLVQADLGDYQQAEAAVQTTVDRFGRLDAVINPVGGWLGGKRLHEHSSEEFDAMLSMDIRPTFHLMKAVLPVMVKQQSGKIVNFGSMTAFTGGSGNAVYAASKSAVARLSAVAAHEYGGDGIQVFLIAPSTIDTEANRQAMPQADTASWVRPETIAEALHYLCQSGENLSSTVFKFTGTL